MAIGDWGQPPASFTSWRAWSWAETCNPTFNHVVVSLGNQSLSWSYIESLTSYLFTVWITINWKVLKEMEIMDHLTCLLRNLSTGQEATVGTANGTMITVNKASGGDGIPAELFKILKDDAVKLLHSICQQIWKTQQWPQDWKRSGFIPIPKKSDAKKCSNYHTVALISHASKVML